MSECFKCERSFDKELKYNVCTKCQIIIYLYDNLIDWIYDRFGYGVDYRRLICVLSDGGTFTPEEFVSECRYHYYSKTFLESMVKRGIATQNTEGEYGITDLGARLVILYGPNSGGLEHLVGIEPCTCDGRVNIDEAIKSGSNTTPEIESYKRFLNGKTSSP